MNIKTKASVKFIVGIISTSMIITNTVRSTEIIDKNDIHSTWLEMLTGSKETSDENSIITAPDVFNVSLTIINSLSTNTYSMFMIQEGILEYLDTFYSESYCKSNDSKVSFIHEGREINKKNFFIGCLERRFPELTRTKIKNIYENCIDSGQAYLAYCFRDVLWNCVDDIFEGIFLRWSSLFSMIQTCEEEMSLGKKIDRLEIINKTIKKCNFLLAYQPENLCKNEKEVLKKMFDEVDNTLKTENIEGSLYKLEEIRDSYIIQRNGIINRKSQVVKKVLKPLNNILNYIDIVYCITNQVDKVIEIFSNPQSNDTEKIQNSLTKLLSESYANIYLERFYNDIGEEGPPFNDYSFVIDSF